MELATMDGSGFTSSRSATILNECREIALKHLPRCINATLDNVDDALFEIANKGDNSYRQNRFFDAMRELRIKRDDFEKDFLRTFSQECRRAISRDKFTTVESKDVSFGDTLELSLVDSDVMEESLAVTNFVANVNSRCREQLFALERRMSMLLSAPDLKRDDIPLGPRVIGNAFKEACEKLNSDIEVKLTLYKLFDRFTTAHIDDMYSEVNYHLIKRDVLPKVPTTARRSPASKRKTRVIADSENQTLKGAGQDVFSTLQDLAKGKPHALTGFGNAVTTPASGADTNYGAVTSSSKNEITSANIPTGGSEGRAVTVVKANPTDGSGNPRHLSTGGSDGGPIQFVDTSQFVDTLTMLQQGDLSSLQESSALTIPSEQFRANLQAGNVNVLSTLSHVGAIGRINETDSMTLDIVSLLFDYVFDDKAIPDFMKALIGKLQIPVLKVALLDKELFSRKSHPARRLIDSLAKSSVGLSNYSADENYAKFAKNIVTYVVENYTDDLEIFNAAANKLEAFLNTQSAQAQERADRAARSLNAREQVVHAKLAVDDELNARLKGSGVREFARQFIKDYWRQLLIVTYIEDGKHSEKWSNQLETVDTLIWSVTDKQDPVEKKHLAEKLPSLLRQIRGGMKMLDMDKQICSKFLSMLASVHVVAVKNDQEFLLAEKCLATERSDEPLQRDISPENKRAFIQQGLQRIFDEKQLNEEELELDPSLFDDDVVVEDVDEEVLPTIKNLNKYLAIATSMDLGDWVEFDNDDGTTKRGRFTWISPSTGRYLFTDQKGQKTLDATLGKLAELFSKDTARRIDSQPDPLFDRALDDLMGRLATA